MAAPVPTDLEDALAANPAARQNFGAMPPEQKDAWIAYLDRARLPRARRRRVADAARRLAGTQETVRETRPVVAPPREDPWVWIIGLALLAGLAAFLLWLTVYHHHHHSKSTPAVATAKSTVPKVVGLRYQAARFQLRQAKLTTKLTRQASPKPRGIVLGQAPKAATTVPHGTPVTLLVSTGPAGVALPNVVGLTAAQAVKALAAHKETAVLHRAPSQSPPGTVFAQKPKAGTKLSPGGTVVLQIAQAKKPAATAGVSVPNVTGQAQAQAVSTLQQAGLRATTAQVPSTQPKGTVVAEHPGAGQKIARGGAVLLNISQGPTTSSRSSPPPTATSTATTAPSGNDYTGMRLGPAVQKLAQGLQQAIVVYVTSNKPAGVVVASSAAGSRERLEVSAGPSPGAPTNVPDVTTEDAATAQQDLQTAGFTVIQVNWPVSDSSEDGVVVAQTPVGGKQVPNGAAIVVYIGTAN
jgi:beta-lactam-binding protein with PASTA domain